MKSNLSSVRIPITHLKTGQFAQIIQVDGYSNYVHRLREMGICKGTEIKIFQSGNPCIVCIEGNKICIGFNNHSNILVQPYMRENLC